MGRGKASFAECDCWGLVVYTTGMLSASSLRQRMTYQWPKEWRPSLPTGHWQEVTQPADGVVFMSYHDGNPAHCGVIIGNRVLHSAGGRVRDGYCRFDRLASLQKHHTDMRYFIHKGAE